MNEIKKGNNKFYIGENENNILGEIHYVPNGKYQIIVNHTYVADELKGTGTGKKLVEKVVQYAKETNKKIVATCPFVKSQLQKNPQWTDVLN